MSRVDVITRGGKIVAANVVDEAGAIVAHFDFGPYPDTPENRAELEEAAPALLEALRSVRRRP